MKRITIFRARWAGRSFGDHDQASEETDLKIKTKDGQFCENAAILIVAVVASGTDAVADVSDEAAVADEAI